MTDHEEILASEFRQLEAMAPITFTLSRPQCFFLLAFLQFALRHSGASGDAAQYARTFAQQLEDAVGVSSALREAVRRGWGDA